ncbi:MAG: hypothetical protein LBP36_03665 [Oscillospiraceae bacterium]|jgi:hypothetical protein|nr:hypothetical protein [Oscillospiraceae bacterium]
MFKKNWFNFILFFSGLIIVVLGFYFAEIIPKEQTGVMFGIGSSLFGVGLALTISNIYNKRHPEVATWKNIQVNDERNKLLRYKANNMVKNINQWMLFALAIITIVAKLPLWLTLSLVGINLIDSFLQIYLTNKYNK